MFNKFNNLKLNKKKFIVKINNILSNNVFKLILFESKLINKFVYNAKIFYVIFINVSNQIFFFFQFLLILYINLYLNNIYKNYQNSHLSFKSLIYFIKFKKFDCSITNRLTNSISLFDNIYIFKIIDYFYVIFKNFN